MGEMFRSATFKLTMWYLAIVMVISLIFSVVVYHFASAELSSGLNQQTERIFREFPVFDANPSLIERHDYDVAVGEHHILLRLVYFNTILLVAAGFASYLLARRTLQPIELAHERQKRFTADVSHELRTPLTSLKMTSEVGLMNSKATKQELHQALESNLEDAVRMEQLINNLLKLTKLDTDANQASFTSIDSRQIATDAIKRVATMAAAKGVSVQDTTQSLAVRGDLESLNQVVVILLDNAIKYSPPGSTITLTNASRGNDVRLSVSDSGQGIQPQALPHVFDRFYREDAARNQTDIEGFGLGLSIAKLIVDAHHGSIMLSSRPGKGTTAVLQLPASATAIPSQLPAEQKILS